MSFTTCKERPGVRYIRVTVNIGGSGIDCEARWRHAYVLLPDKSC
jgi:hypothetical protein